MHCSKGIMNVTQYIDILQKPLLSSMKEHFGHCCEVFMQDNYPKHIQWPTCIPVLHSIVNLWGILIQVTDTKKHIKIVYKMWENCKEMWSLIAPELCQKLVKSLPKMTLNAL